MRRDEEISFGSAEKGSSRNSPAAGMRPVQLLVLGAKASLPITASTFRKSLVLTADTTPTPHAYEAANELLDDKGVVSRRQRETIWFVLDKLLSYAQNELSVCL